MVLANIMKTNGPD